MPYESTNYRFKAPLGSEIINVGDNTLRDLVDQLDAKIRALEDSSVPRPGSLLVSAANTSPPAGYLRTDGSFKRQADYPDLFVAIGHFYNGGVDPRDGTFQLPQYNGLALVAAGGVNTEYATTARVLGTAWGSETHRLVEAELPEHTHGLSPIGRVASGSDGNYGIGIQNPDSAMRTGSTGGSGAHNNTQPSVAVNVWIKT